MVLSKIKKLRLSAFALSVFALFIMAHNLIALIPYYVIFYVMYKEAL